MWGKRKLNQIENDDWNNFNDSESEIVTVKKRVTKDLSSKILTNAR